MAQLDQTPFPFATSAELVVSIVTALAGHAGELAALRSLTNGHPYFDNRSTDYSSQTLPAPAAGEVGDDVGAEPIVDEGTDGREVGGERAGLIRKPGLEVR